jgi:hypothetical protein
MDHQEADDTQGNLLSKGHLDKAGGASSLYKQISAIVGANYVQMLGDNKIFFMLPDMDRSRQAVERLLESCGLLMHPSP